jgi:hypothetical protein
MDDARRLLGVQCPEGGARPPRVLCDRCAHTFSTRSALHTHQNYSCPGRPVAAQVARSTRELALCDSGPTDSGPPDPHAQDPLPPQQTDKGRRRVRYEHLPLPVGQARVSYGDPDMRHLPDAACMRMLARRQHGALQLLQQIYFNRQVPHNMVFDWRDVSGTTVWVYQPRSKTWRESTMQAALTLLVEKLLEMASLYLQRFDSMTCGEAIEFNFGRQYLRQLVDQPKATRAFRAALRKAWRGWR